MMQRIEIHLPKNLNKELERRLDIAFDDLSKKNSDTVFLLFKDLNRREIRILGGELPRVLDNILFDSFGNFTG